MTSIEKHKCCLLFIASLLLFFSGCSPTVDTAVIEKWQRPNDAEMFFASLQRSIEKADVMNAVYTPIAGFPYLRSSRFLSGIKNQLKTREQHLAWIKQLNQNAIYAWKTEILALPEKSVAELAGQKPENTADARTDLISRMKTHSGTLMQHDLRQLDVFETIKSSEFVPDDYSILMRTFGLYPLAYLPVAFFTDRAFDKMREWHEKPLTPDRIDGTMVSYTGDGGESLSAAEIPGFFSQLPVNALDMQILSKEDKRILARTFAPVIVQDTVADYDKLIHFGWKDPVPFLDASTPASYYYTDYTLVDQTPLIQIVYTFWYTAREGDNPPWFEEGITDGLTYRLTLDRKGRPFLVDVMNNCGCYHFFVPDTVAVKEILSPDFEIDPLVLDRLPDFSPKNPIHLKISSGWHQVTSIIAAPAPENAIPYRLISYDTLESIPVSDRHRSIFNSEGIVINSERIEPYIFFSMGIPDVGYMRQRGHHPTKLLGREHFDNPYLFENNFNLSLPVE